MNALAILNLASVGGFGLILSARFCDIRWTWQKKLFMAGSMSLIMLLQGIILFYADLHTAKRLYPLVTHIPLTIALCILSKEFLWPLIAVLTAYLCCQLRRWLALLAISIFSGGELMQDAVELIATLPLLLLLLRVIAPSVRSISHCTTAEKQRLGLVPLLYYGYDYLTIFYADLLSERNQAVAEFMPFVCSAAYLIFALRISEGERIRMHLQQTQETLNLQITQAVREIGILRQSQEQSKAYRHDLRHHMLYLLSCIENEQPAQAQAYIKEICSKIEAATVTVFCENEATNLDQPLVK